VIVNVALGIVVGAYIAAFVALKRKGYWNDDR
jgi:hypothetical protein